VPELIWVPRTTSTSRSRRSLGRAPTKSAGKSRALHLISETGTRPPPGFLPRDICTHDKDQRPPTRIRLIADRSIHRQRAHAVLGIASMRPDSPTAPRAALRRGRQQASCGNNRQFARKPARPSKQRRIAATDLQKDYLAVPPQARAPGRAPRTA
jgi:hypothetical protein